MTKNCITVHPEILAAEALQLMDVHKINALLITDNNNRVCGALNLHALLRAGVV